MSMRLREVLRDKPHRVITLPRKASVSEASALMLLERVGAILICEGGCVLGVLSERDLALAVAVRGPGLFKLTVGELMSANVPTATPDDSVRDVMQTMTEKRARHVPVIEGEAVVGMVSIGDVLKSRLAEKIQENAVLQDLARAHIPD